VPSAYFPVRRLTQTPLQQRSTSPSSWDQSPIQAIAFFLIGLRNEATELIKILLWAITISSLPAQTSSHPQSLSSHHIERPFRYETSRTQASEILRPEFLRNIFQCARRVPTFSRRESFHDRFEFGVFEAEGNEMLVRPYRRINASPLKEVSRRNEFKGALVKAAKSPAPLRSKS